MFRSLIVICVTVAAATATNVMFNTLADSKVPHQKDLVFSVTESDQYEIDAPGCEVPEFDLLSQRPPPPSAIKTHGCESLSFLPYRNTTIGDKICDQVASKLNATNLIPTSGHGQGWWLQLGQSFMDPWFVRSEISFSNGAIVMEGLLATKYDCQQSSNGVFAQGVLIQSAVSGVSGDFLGRRGWVDSVYNFAPAQGLPVWCTLHTFHFVSFY